MDMVYIHYSVLLHLCKYMCKYKKYVIMSLFQNSAPKRRIYFGKSSLSVQHKALNVYSNGHHAFYSAS